MWVELVNAYADSLLEDNLRVTDFKSQAERSGDLAELFQLTDQIAALLTPVEPEPEFVQQLGQELVATAAPAEITVAQPSHRWFWLGALVSGGLVSAVGALAVWWLRRGRHRTVTAST